MTDRLHILKSNPFLLGLGRILFWPDTGYPPDFKCRISGSGRIFGQRSKSVNLPDIKRQKSAGYHDRIVLISGRIFKKAGYPAQR